MNGLVELNTLNTRHKKGQRTGTGVKQVIYLSHAHFIFYQVCVVSSIDPTLSWPPCCCFDFLLCDWIACTKTQDNKESSSQTTYCYWGKKKYWGKQNNPSPLVFPLYVPLELLQPPSCVTSPGRPTTHRVLPSEWGGPNSSQNQQYQQPRSAQTPRQSRCMAGGRSTPTCLCWNELLPHDRVQPPLVFEFGVVISTNMKVLMCMFVEIFCC